MRVMLVSPVFPGSLGNYCWRALGGLGHDVHVFDYRAVAYGRDYYKYGRRSLFRRVYGKLVDPVRRMNRKLLARAKGFQPELVLAIKGELLAPETVQDIAEEQDIPFVLWYPDASSYLDARPSFQNTRLALEHYTVSFFADVAGISPSVRDRIKRLEYLTFGCDPSVHKSWDLTDAERAEYGSKVCFVGNSHSDGSIRDTILIGLADLDVTIWGRGWERRELYAHWRSAVRPPAYGDELAKVYSASKIALNINGDYPYLNMRNFEAPACGTMLLTSAVDQLADCYEIGSEVVAFTDLSDLRDKIDYYLAHEDERAAIAEAGQRRALQDHTVAHRMQEMLAILGGLDRDDG